MAETVFITDMKSNPKLAQIQKSMTEMEERYKQQANFIFKQLDNMKEAAKKEATQAWDAIELELKESKLLPANYNKEEHVLSINHDNTQLFMKDKAAVLAEVLAELKGKLNEGDN